EEPADVVRRAPPAVGWSQILQAAICVLLVGAGLACEFFHDYLPPRTGVFVAPVLMLVGLLGSAPLLTSAASGIFRVLARWFLCLPERLAADTLAREPGRTGRVIAALAAGVALMVQTAGVMRSSEDTILAWIDRAVSADLFVTAQSPITSAGQALPMDEDIGKLLESLPEVRRAVPVRYQSVDFRGTKVYVMTVDAADFLDRQRLADPIPGLELFPRLVDPGTVLVSENF